jgi:hypothetical protein
VQIAETAQQEHYCLQDVKIKVNSLQFTLINKPTKFNLRDLHRYVKKLRVVSQNINLLLVKEGKSVKAMIHRKDF